MKNENKFSLYSSVVNIMALSPVNIEKLQETIKVIERSDDPNKLRNIKFIEALMVIVQNPENQNALLVMRIIEKSNEDGLRQLFENLTLFLEKEKEKECRTVRRSPRIQSSDSKFK